MFCNCSQYCRDVCVCVCVGGGGGGNSLVIVHDGVEPVCNSEDGAGSKL